MQVGQNGNVCVDGMNFTFPNLLLPLVIYTPLITFGV